ncbi:cytochrome c oxidase subunit II [Neobacillus sp. PS3-12]|uniref:cytochrome c oxidase subunit II n=1 Tax=Neobacillus sp. PS3-12 TaxID=3070677 RepID=UPI0027E00730|nr:cytochrome c oxidase subunit II [Neobacillus sp. PS3-12]WML51075.1 cytochrome c oxidase subunit II [Neobacillus sp. PS3-12]
MHIHKYERIWLTFGIAMLIVFLTIVGVNAFMMGRNPPSGLNEIDPDHVRETVPFNHPGLHKIGDNRYELDIVSSAFSYDVGTSDKVIKIPKGATVTFRAATTDVIHGLSLAGTNVNMMVEPGYISDLTVKLKNAGTFTMVCNEYCGSGHQMMYATVEVVDNGK